MSTVLDRTAADTIMEQAIAHAEVGKNFFLRTFKHVPEDKLNWCPAPTSKSALRIAAHVALGNSAFASILRGEKPPFTSMEAMFASMDRAELRFESRIEVLDRIDSSYREVRSAIEALRPDAVGTMVETGLMHLHESNKKPGVEMGYGNCTHNGCICPAFDGNGELCGNCGHNYSYHN